jgi:hypothetical protein
MHKELYQVLKEYVLWTDLDYSVKGRVVEWQREDPNLRYGWEVSHHYKPSKGAAGVYRPSRTVGPRADEMEHLMLAYMRGFTGIDVIPNPHY